MCLAVPGKITSISGDDPLSRVGKIDFGGVLKDASLAFVPEAQVGDYVIVHVGFALSRVDEEEAQKVFEYLREIEELSELEADDRSSPEAAVLRSQEPGALNPGRQPGDREKAPSARARP